MQLTRMRSLFAFRSVFAFRFVQNSHVDEFPTNNFSEFQKMSKQGKSKNVKSIRTCQESVE